MATSPAVDLPRLPRGRTRAHQRFNALLSAVLGQVIRQRRLDDGLMCDPPAVAVL